MIFGRIAPFATLLMVLALCVGAPAGQSDTQPPVLVDLTMSAAAVDITSGVAVVTLRAHLTDDLSGVAGAGYLSSPTQVRFQSPSGRQFVDAVFHSQLHLVSGTPTDGLFESALRFPQYSETGIWTVAHFLLVDQVGNNRTLTGASLAAAGLPNAIELTGTGDTAPPALQQFSLSPLLVDVTTAAATVRVAAQVTDNLAGIAGAGFSSSPSQLRLVSPSGLQSVDAVLDDSARIAGTALDSKYEYHIKVPQFAEAGVWRIANFMLVDQLGNTARLSPGDLEARGFPAEFSVISVSDTTAPVLRAFDFSPRRVDVATGPVVVTFTARLTDDIAGVAGSGYSSSPSQVLLVSPSGVQSVWAIFAADQQRLSGTPLDGEYRSTAVVPQFSESGVWRVRYFLLVDQIGNMRNLAGSEIAALNFPTELIVGDADITPPVLSLPVDRVVEATSPAGAAVEYHVSADDDRDGEVQVSCSASSGSVFPLGRHPIQCQAQDAAGNMTTGSFTVTVRDATAPIVLALTPSQSVLWPPNGEMVALTLRVEATDAADAAPRSSVVEIGSDEPAGGGGTRPTVGDWVFGGDLAFSLRAARSGRSDGRVYTIIVETRDASGNITRSSTVVRVAKSQSIR